MAFLAVLLNFILIIGFVISIYNIIFAFPRKMDRLIESNKNIEDSLEEIKNRLTNM